MAWNGDPFTGGRPGDTTHRPRQGALLKGYVYLYKKSAEKKEKWLKVIETRAKGKSEFVNVDNDKWIHFGETRGSEWLTKCDA
jgi:hypothetical protein